MYTQPGYYAGFYNDSSESKTYFVTALISSSFQSCEREGRRTGCLYRYDDPDRQCKGKRKGERIKKEWME